MKSSHETGQTGQLTAEVYLQKKGHKILARNFRKKTGEIDLVTNDGEYIVFVEVKARKGLTHGYPREAVGAVKQKRIMDTAQHYLIQNNLAEVNIRFDVVEVLINHEGTFVSHIENAFTG